MSSGLGSSSSASKKALILIKAKDGDKQVTCHFNPETYTISRDVNWRQQEIIGGNTPPSEFSGGGPNKINSLSLLFDISLASGVTDVRDITKELWNATKIDNGKVNSVTGKSEPPHVVFSWGRSWYFESVITSLSEEFLLFSSDGLPTRSKVTISLTQIKDDTSFKKQNPTSGGIPDGKLYTVREGDRLDLIAYRFYDKPTLWRKIADYNHIENPGKLRAGQRLIIPPLS